MRKMFLLPLSFGLSAGLSAVTALVASGQSVNGQGHDPKEDEDGVEAHGKVIHQINPDPGKVFASRSRGGGGGGNGISYHGGPLILGGMSGGVNVYVIWYGNWTGNTATTIIPDFLSNEGGSPYYNINTTYYNGSNAHIVNKISYLGSTTDNYSQGKSLGDAQIQAIVSSAISSKELPSDSNGVYFVLTSSDVSETSGFCTQYCGWHTYGTIGGTNIKYAFVGNPDRCPNACEAQTGSSPNGNTGADGMVSVIAHELEESASDPDLNAWFDSRGEENADKCAWTFGSTYVTANGSLANMKLGTHDFLVQQNWVNANGGYCALSH